jgi:hypothetical protein
LCSQIRTHVFRHYNQSQWPEQEHLFSDESSKNNDLSFFKIYPNPTTGKLTLELTEISEKMSITIEVYSMKGEKLLMENLFGANIHLIDLSSKQPGLYFIRVMKEDKVGIEKVIKM